MSYTKLNFLFFLLILFYLGTFFSFSQIPSPYNLSFESGYDGSPVFGWILGRTASDSGFVALTSEHLPSHGLSCARIINTRNLSLQRPVVGSLYQRISVGKYINRRVRFTAYVKPGELLDEALDKTD